MSTDNYRYEDVPQGKPGEPLIHTVTGLSLATQYLFSVMAYNKLGHSKYLPDLVKSKTAGEFLNGVLFYILFINNYM